MIYKLPVNVVESVRNLRNNFHTIFLGQLHDFLVCALTVRLCINLESQPSDLPFLKELWKDLCGRPTDNKQPRGTRNKKLQNMLNEEKHICPHLTPSALSSNLHLIFSSHPYLELSFFRLASRSLRASIRNLHRLMPMQVFLEYQGSSRNRG